MFCSGCGTKNENDAVFCVNCGKKLVANATDTGSNTNTSFDNNVSNNVNVSDNSETLKSTNLSTASLVCLIIKIVSIFVGAVSSIKWFFELPWLLASLVLAIISRVKYKDKRSKTLIIVDSILLVLEFILFIIITIFLSALITGILKGCSSLG